MIKKKSKLRIHRQLIKSNNLNKSFQLSILFAGGSIHLNIIFKLARRCA